MLQIKTERAKMANENIGSTAGESSPQNERAHSEREEWRSTSEDLKSAATTMAEDYRDKATQAWDDAKVRVRTLQEDGEDYVRENPMKAVMTALGIGFVLGLIFRR
jgi:ElaB/YqjD/DUF883 family membrane-anchored ribosome-binding protein